MNWKFWKKPSNDAAGAGQETKLEKPRDLPEAVGRKMVVAMKIDPDEVWALKYVSRPVAERKKTNEFRIYSPVKANVAGVAVKNWTSLDEHLELVMYAGIYDKGAGQVDFQDI